VGSGTETGAYAFTSEFGISARNPNAKYFLPTVNEWYKAAYYDPTKGGSGYWLFAVRSDCEFNATTCPDGIIAELPPGGPHSANFNTIVPNTTGDNPYNLSDVGAYTAASSYYGTFDQSGLQWEWCEPLPGAGATRRMGGSQGNGAARLQSNAYAENGFGGISANQSFRVAAQAVGAVVYPTLSIQRVGSDIKISWTGSGTLIQSTDVKLPISQWTPVPGNPAGSYTVTPAASGPPVYYRLEQ
jgi:hypothetical protein